MDGAALAGVAEKAAAHPWSFTRDGLVDAVGALGWEIGEARGIRLRLRTPFERASALLDGDQVLAVECSLVPPVEVDPGDAETVARTESQMDAAFQEAVRRVEGAVGPPAFRGDRADPAFPEDEDFASRMATWETGTARLALKLLHEDQDLPYRLSFVVEPAR